MKLTGKLRAELAAAIRKGKSKLLTPYEHGTETHSVWTDIGRVIVVWNPVKGTIVTVWHGRYNHERAKKKKQGGQQ